MNSPNKISFSEEEKIQKRLTMTHTERFHLLMRLIRISKMLSNAKIIPADSK